MTEQSETQNKILRWYSNNPLMGLASTVLTLSGVLLAIYFYLASIKERELAYYSDPIKTVVVKSGQASEIEVHYRGRIVSSDVTGVQVLVWNNGEESIHKENILSEVKIVTKPSVPILEAKITKLSRMVTQLEINSKLFSEGIVPISWLILEKNDGALIQLIYEGSPDVEIILEGTIEGQAKFTRAELGEKIKSPTEQLASAVKSKKSRLYEVIVGPFPLIYVIILIVIGLIEFKTGRNRVLRYVVLIGTLSLFFVMIHSIITKFKEPLLPPWY